MMKVRITRLITEKQVKTYTTTHTGTWQSWLHGQPICHTTDTLHTLLREAPLRYLLCHCHHSSENKWLWLRHWRPPSSCGSEGELRQSEMQFCAKEEHNNWTAHHMSLSPPRWYRRSYVFIAAYKLRRDHGDAKELSTKAWRNPDIAHPFVIGAQALRPTTANFHWSLRL